MASKVKPLIKCPENENLLYCLYGEIPFREIDCPFATETGRGKEPKFWSFCRGATPILGTSF
jgi:hypothetical protein